MGAWKSGVGSPARWMCAAASDSAADSLAGSTRAITGTSRLAALVGATAVKASRAAHTSRVFRKSRRRGEPTNDVRIVLAAPSRITNASGRALSSAKSTAVRATVVTA